MTALAWLLATIFAPGFVTSEPVRTALAVGGGAAIVSAVVGVFTVIRGQTFAGHALADVSSAGGAASFLLGINPLLGFLAAAVIGAGGMELLRVPRARERDLLTGVVLGAGLGLTALFLYFDVTSKSTTGAAMMVMFGSMFAIPAALVPIAIAVGAGALVVTALFYQQLLLSSLDADLARALGIRPGLVGLIHSIVLALAVALSAITVGAILSTALLIGPAAIALRMANRVGAAIALAVLIGLAAMFGGILLAYDSYSWTPGHTWPVSFFVVALIFGLYVATARVGSARGRRTGLAASGGSPLVGKG